MEPVELAALFHAEPGAGLTLRLYRAVQRAARSGRLRAGEALPSSRAAAGALGLSRNSVCAAYDLLLAEGVIETAPGRRPRVREGTPVAVPVPVQAPALSARGRVWAVDPRAGQGAEGGGLFAPGEPDPALFPADAFAQRLRRAARQLAPRASGYADYHGLPALRAAIADQLVRHRGLRIEAGQVLVLPGMQAGLALLAQTLAAPGDTALVEDPGYAGARAAFAGAGLRLASLPVDAEGACIEGAGPARLIYVTPSTQYPTGARMSLPRRQALLAAAQARGAVVIEDDYDSEFLWRGGAIPALHALAGGAGVIYLGTAAKSLAPGLRLAWAVVPPALAGPLAQASRNLGMGANVHAQAALAGLLADGAWRAHLRRIARAYAAREALLAGALAERFGPALRLRRPDGGLQLVAEFAAPHDEAPVLDALRGAGFAVAALSGYCLRSPRRGLVIGFAEADAPRVLRFCDALARAFDAMAA
ncbi:MAG: MocR-like pyridoxine biosynthesis transcription factor PdxR [Alkalilacustris sp.]